MKVFPHMDEAFYDHILAPLDDPGERTAFYLGLVLAVEAPVLAMNIRLETERRWEVAVGRKQKVLVSPEEYVAKSIQQLIAEYKATLD